ncbi:hypothetical protein ACFXTO_016351 [Malus domestica]
MSIYLHRRSLQFNILNSEQHLMAEKKLPRMELFQMLSYFFSDETFEFIDHNSIRHCKRIVNNCLAD